jgi:hypothetical protein
MKSMKRAPYGSLFSSPCSESRGQILFSSLLSCPSVLVLLSLAKCLLYLQLALKQKSLNLMFR